MKAMVQEMRAKVVESEAEVPRLCQALRQGKWELWTIQYEKYYGRPQMRDSISKNRAKMILTKNRIKVGD